MREAGDMSVLAKWAKFAMVRADWATVGGPQAGKISRIPVSRSTINTMPVALLRDFLHRTTCGWRIDGIIVVVYV